MGPGLSHARLARMITTHRGTATRKSAKSLKGYGPSRLGNLFPRSISVRGVNYEPKESVRYDRRCHPQALTRRAVESLSRPSALGHEVIVIALPSDFVHRRTKPRFPEDALAIIGLEGRGSRFASSRLSRTLINARPPPRDEEMTPLGVHALSRPMVDRGDSLCTPGLAL